VLIGRRIVRAETRRPDLRFPFPENFARRLQGRRVEALDRRAKYLLATLDDGMIWVIHLGMTGRFWLPGANAQPGDFYYAAPPDPLHTHVVLETDHGRALEFNDPRRFGYMDLIPAADLAAHPYFARMGPEPLGPDFGLETLTRAFKGKTASIKAALLDQSVVAGLGNIYVCEALYRAGISPQRLAGKVQKAKLPPLIDAIRAVLEEAILAGGSTLSDYAAVDGAMGGFQHRFAVYDRAGADCAREGCGGMIQRAVQAGRSSFWCAKCQR